MIQHKRDNWILALKNQEGHLIHSQEEMEEEGHLIHSQEEMEDKLTQYFSTLLTEPRNNQADDIQKITNHIPKILTEDHNKMLMKKVSLQEVGWVYHWLLQTLFVYLKKW